MLDPINDHDERVQRIALAYLSRPGDTHIADHVRRHGFADTIRGLADHHSELAKTGRRDCHRHLHTDPGRLLTAAADLTEHAVIPGDPWWPEQPLRDLTDHGIATPWCLWIKTKHPIAPHHVWGRGISVIGTGDHTGHGYDTTTVFTRGLSYQRIPVVTQHHSTYTLGLADLARLHTTQHSDGTSVVIGNEPATGPLATTGSASQPTVYLTTTPDGVTDTSQHLADHHAQLQAALTRATLVVETGTEPHVLAHIEAARALERPVFTVPGPAQSPASSYCHHLIRQGHARLVTDTHELTSDLTQPTRTTQGQGQ